MNILTVKLFQFLLLLHKQQMKNIFLIFFIFRLSFLFSQTPTQTIKGFIIDKQSQVPLIGVSIQLVNSNPLLGAISNDKGEFKILNVPIGRWQLIAKSVSYKEKVISIILNSGKESISNIELEEIIINGEEIIITTERVE